MKWTICINQKGCIDAKMNLDIIDLAIFDFLKDYTHTPACKKMTGESGAVYFTVPYKKVLDELPLLPMTKVDAVYRRYKKLEMAGVLDMHPDNAKMAMVWFCWGRNYDKLLFSSASINATATPGFKTEGMQDDPRFKNRTPSVFAPTHSTSFPNYSLSPAQDENFSPVEAEEEKKEVGPGAGAAAAADVSLYDSPNAKTPLELEEAMKNFFRSPTWKREWTDGVVKVAGAWIPDTAEKQGRLVSILSDFCRHQIKINNGGDTYQMLNAGFQAWVSNERHSKWKQAKAPAATNNTSPAPRPIVRAGRD